MRGGEHRGAAEWVLPMSAPESTERTARVTAADRLKFSLRAEVERLRAENAKLESIGTSNGDDLAFVDDLRSEVSRLTTRVNDLRSHAVGLEGVVRQQREWLAEKDAQVAQQEAVIEAAREYRADMLAAYEISPAAEWITKTGSGVKLDVLLESLRLAPPATEKGGAKYAATDVAHVVRRYAEHRGLLVPPTAARRRVMKLGRHEDVPTPRMLDDVIDDLRAELATLQRERDELREGKEHLAGELTIALARIATLSRKEALLEAAEKVIEESVLRGELCPRCGGYLLTDDADTCSEALHEAHEAYRVLSHPVGGSET